MLPQTTVFRAALVLGMSLAVTGCSSCNKKDKATPGAEASASAAKPLPPPPRGRQVFTGPLGEVLEATFGQNLGEEQKKVVGEAMKVMRAPKGVLDPFDAELSEQVRAGKIDRAKLDPIIEDHRKFIRERAAQEDAALVTVHDALSPEQREGVVAAARAEQESRERTPEAPPPAASLRLERLLDGLNLDPAQQSKVKALFHSSDGGVDPNDELARSKAESRLKEILVEFDKPKLDPGKLTPIDTSLASKGLEEMATTLEKVVPLLTDAQRQTLSTRIHRVMPRTPSEQQRGGHGGPGMDRHGFPGRGPLNVPPGMSARPRGPRPAGSL